MPSFRRVVSQAVLLGVPVPAFSSALSFFDGYRSAKLPANLLQAQVIFYFFLESKSCVFLMFL
jgi:6-phosphogluconate dehydrogenase